MIRLICITLRKLKMSFAFVILIGIDENSGYHLLVHVARFLLKLVLNEALVSKRLHFMVKSSERIQNTQVPVRSDKRIRRDYLLKSEPTNFVPFNIVGKQLVKVTAAENKLTKAFYWFKPT